MSTNKRGHDDKMGDDEVTTKPKKESSSSSTPVLPPATVVGAGGGKSYENSASPVNNFPTPSTTGGTTTTMNLHSSSAASTTLEKDARDQNDLNRKKRLATFTSLEGDERETKKKTKTVEVDESTSVASGAGLESAATATTFRTGDSLNVTPEEEQQKKNIDDTSKKSLAVEEDSQQPNTKVDGTKSISSSPSDVERLDAKKKGKEADADLLPVNKGDGLPRDVVPSSHQQQLQTNGRKLSEKKRKRRRRRKHRPPAYRWLDSGTIQPDKSVVHYSLEVIVRGRRYVVSIGDSVLLCSNDELVQFESTSQDGDDDDDDDHDDDDSEILDTNSSSKDKGKKQSSGDDTNHSEVAKRSDGIEDATDGTGGIAALKGVPEINEVHGRANLEKKKDEDDLYGDKDEDAHQEDVHYQSGDQAEEEDYHDDDSDIIRTLDPFVARVEKMWEEHPPIQRRNQADPNRGKRGKFNHNISSRSNKINSGGGTRVIVDSDSGSDQSYVKDEERVSRMKIRARWYFKKEDLEGLDGQFLGASRKHLLSTMSPRDLILGNHTDDNEITTILGKCQVLRRKPLPERFDRRDTAAPNPAGAMLTNLPKGAYVCRYDVSINPPPPRSNGVGTVVLTPYSGEDEEGSNEELSSAVIMDGTKSKKRSRTNDEGMSSSSRKSNTASRTVSGDKDNYARSTSADGVSNRGEAGMHSSGRPSSPSKMADTENRRSNRDGTMNSSSSDDDEDDDAAGSDGSSSSYPKPNDVSDNKPTETEGSTTEGTIRIGPKHQAIVPPLSSDGHNSRLRTSRNPPLVWRPNAISEEDVSKYLSDAAHILESFMNGMDYASSGATSFGGIGVHGIGGNNLSATGTKGLTRECNVDSLLTLLHDKNYDTQAALDAVSANPRDYLTLWTKHEKELFNAGFRRYCGSLRMISKGVASSKGFKDVVDYHYRFKIPDQFRRYQEKKREQARRMMECVENRRFNESLVQSTDDTAGVRGSASGSGSSGGSGINRRLRNWSKTGATSGIGAAEQRRESARDFLIKVRDTIGIDKYLQIASFLKSYHARDASIPTLKANIGDLLKNHPELLERFLEFLPKKFRA